MIQIIKENNPPFPPKVLINGENQPISSFADLNGAIKHWTKQSPLTLDVTLKKQTFSRYTTIKKWLVQYYLTSSSSDVYLPDYKQVANLNIYAITLKKHPDLILPPKVLINGENKPLSSFADLNATIKHWTKRSPITLEIVCNDQVIPRLEQIKKWLVQHYLTTPTSDIYQLEYKQIQELDIYAILLNINPQLNKTIAFKIPIISEKVYTSPFFGAFSTQSKPQINPIHLDKMIKNWTQETTLILEFVHTTHIRPKIKQIKRLICNHHLKEKDSYLYQIEVLNASSILPQITDKIEKDKTLQRYHAIALSRKNRAEPDLKDQIDKNQNLFDFITLETTPKEIWSSPRYIYLPNNVMETKGCIQAIFNQNKKEFSHPIDNRVLSNKECQIIIDQILKIFQISSEEFSSCFDLKLSDKAEQDIMSDTNNQVINNQGKISKKVIDCLKYSYHTLDFDRFYDTLMSGIERLLANISPFFEFILLYHLNTLLDTIPHRSLSIDQVFSRIETILMEENNGKYQIEVSFGPGLALLESNINTAKYQLHLVYQSSLPPNLSNQYGNLLKAKLIKQFLIPVLFRTFFFIDEKKEALTKAKIKMFESLTGISLSD